MFVPVDARRIGCMSDVQHDRDGWFQPVRNHLHTGAADGRSGLRAEDLSAYRHFNRLGALAAQARAKLLNDRRVAHRFHVMAIQGRRLEVQHPPRRIVDESQPPIDPRRVNAGFLGQLQERFEPGAGITGKRARDREPLPTGVPPMTLAIV